jgi:2,3,4,5-tetrahydropyridine-2-carboxylate N-succinyltransferase
MMMTLATLENDFKTCIEQAFEQRETLSPDNASTALKQAIDTIILGLEKGTFRIAEKQDGTWHVHQWLKKAILLYFRLHNSTPISAGFTQFYDKVPTRFADTSEAEFKALGIRIVPPTVVRTGAYIAPNTILMPSFINIGAFVDSGTLVDTWATVGSCAQIGKNVHLSGGVGIGGVLEPLQANPTIIEDNCFIGARSEIVEGVIVEEGSVISMGVYIGQSTRIYDRETGEITYGRIPAGSVVVSGNLPSTDGKYSLYSAVIVKRVDAKTRAKTALNDLLRL